ncbi:uncharacterized protein HD556DRAFT_1525521 [Suillus plorans]|uniref:DUF6533 domain-containing protein n=1 Tax=Suillus plorans TaxID=116603 RepID=A0A9P7IZU9_9AGAM|nr:uncharacterized protein HD556DRAFT_1525521 [Suillus plorans]KAG1798452.1 hypothetical protein HD556DRAFT_1525521 [Suillus plorans]
MTYVSNDPSFWPMIDWNIAFGYWTVATGLVVVYDWMLTLAQEIELIWGQRWSLMTALYILVRYAGIPYSVYVLKPISWCGTNSSRYQYQCSVLYANDLADRCSNVVYRAVNGMSVVVPAMLGVIMIARLHAMYQGSRTMLIFLVIIFLAINIACGVITAIGLKNTAAEELILSGVYMCYNGPDGDGQLLISMVWLLNTVWEVFALCLSVWIAVKHFRDLRRLGPLTGLTIGDCFTVLIKSHVIYFASFVCVSCIQLITFVPELENPSSNEVVILYGAAQILFSVQMFVLGPRLILSVRQYHAKLVSNSDAEFSMNSIVFEERVHVPTSSTV